MRLSLAALWLLASVGSAWAADPAASILLKVTPQVVEADRAVSWEQPLSKAVAPGVPVVVNIDAESLSIRVTVTPFLRGDDYLLVVQGEVRQSDASGVRRASHLNSLVTPANRPVMYYPLGPADESGRRMVVVIVAGKGE